MTDKPFQVAATLTGFATKLDGGATVRFATNELADEDILELKRRQGQFGFLLFKPNEFDISEIPAEDAEDKNKTPSRRLRAVLFILWKQLGAKGDFELYYRAQVEKLVEHIKGKLD